MALDREALRKKMEQWSTPTNSSICVWKPAKGKNLVRIVPFKNNPGDPFTELLFTYMGGKTLFSPLSFGKPDPIDEFGKKLREGGGLSKDDWKDTKQFVATPRWFVPIIDRANPDKGVQYWGLSKTTRDALVAIMLDEDFGDIVDVTEGRDIKVTSIPKEDSDTGFAKVEIMVSPKQTPLSSDHAQVKVWLHEQPDLLSSYTQLTYEQLKEKLTTFMTHGDNPEVPAKVESVNDEEWGESPTVEKSKKAETVGAKTNVDEEFARLFEKD